MTAVKQTANFIRCKNCNKIAILTKTNRDGYCSDECRFVYTRCTTCGKYFIFNQNNTDENKSQQNRDFIKRSCSEECKIIYILHKNSRKGENL